MPPYPAPGAARGAAPPPGAPGMPHGYPTGQPAHAATQPAFPAPAQSAFPMPSRPRKSRGALRFVAGTCVFSAWITLILSVVGGLGTIAMGATSSGALVSHLLPG